MAKFEYVSYAVSGDGTRLGFSNKDSVNLGTAEIQIVLKRLANLPKVMKTEFLDDVGRSIRRIAIARAPELTGNLKSNIEYSVRSGELEVTSTAIDEHTGHDYAPVQEFGGVNDEGKWVEAQPYFFRSVEDTAQAIELYIGKAIEEGVDTEYMPSFNEFMKKVSLGIAEQEIQNRYRGGGGGANIQGIGLPASDASGTVRLDDIGFGSTNNAANKLIDPEGGYGSSLESGFGDFGDDGYWLGRD